MKITRFHLVLTLMALAAAGLFISEMKHRPAKPSAAKEKPVTAPVYPVTPFPAVIPPMRTVPVNRELAAKAVAVAGEYWKITKKEFREYSTGGSTLRSAKRELANKNYDGALTLARLSIKQLKKAKKYGINYKVKSGDCLWSIAGMKKHYGNSAMWYSILRANKKIIRNYKLIFTKQILYIPWVKKTTNTNALSKMSLRGTK